MTALLAFGGAYLIGLGLALLFNRGAHRKPTPPLPDPVVVYARGADTGTTGELVIEDTSPTT